MTPSSPQIVTDTNVVSEFMRATPSSAGLSWASGVAPDQLFVTTITVQEVEYGIWRLPDGTRRRQLDERWKRLLDSFGSQVLAYDAAAAHQTARVLAHREALGRPIGMADAQIAGVCLANEAQLATRNTKDFELVKGLALIDPFEQAR